MNPSEFLKIKTNYLKIGIYSILSFGVLWLLFFIEVLAIFFLYGSGAGASRVAELWYVDLIFNYLPLLLVGSFWLYRAIRSYQKQQKEKFKTYVIILPILLVLFIFRNRIYNLLFWD